MATYQFRCSDDVCGAVVEVESPITEPVPRGPVYCFQCAIARIPKLSPMRRLWNPAGVIFRGGGWASKS